MIRKGPTDSATKHPVGKKMRGNDGNMWVIINTSNGVHRWAKSKSSPRISQKRKRRSSHRRSRKRRRRSRSEPESEIKTEKKEPRKGTRYFTHNNGDKPYMVIVDNKNVYVYRYSDDFPHLEDLKANDYTVLVKEYLGVKEIFIGKAVKGDDSSKMSSSKTIGNSILLEISNGRYAFIGGLIYEFEPKDKIVEYYSMIGNSDVPYPVAIGEKNVYFVVSGGRNGYLSRDYFEGFPSKYSWGLDSYQRLWGTGKFKPDAEKANVNKTKKRVGRLSSKPSLEKDTHKLPKLKVIDARR